MSRLSFDMVLVPEEEGPGGAGPGLAGAAPARTGRGISPAPARAAAGYNGAAGGARSVAGGRVHARRFDRLPKNASQARRAAADVRADRSGPRVRVTGRIPAARSAGLMR